MNRLKNLPHPTKRYLSTCLLGFAALICGASPAWAVVSLGTASDFAILAGTAVTCTNGTVVVGDVGVSPGTAITQTSCSVAGTVHPGDAVAAQAKADFITAYNALAAVSCDQTLTGTLDGMTLAPGVYCFDAAATLTGTLTLAGAPTDTWVFKVGTLGTGALTGTNFSVVMADGGDACHVKWWVAEAATMTDSNLKGTVLAGAAITSTRGSQVGRLLAKAAVTVTGTSIVGCDSLTSPPICTIKKPKGWGWLNDHGRWYFYNSYFFYKDIK